MGLLLLVSAIKLTTFFFFISFPSTEAYDPLDPNGNITIKWDVISWTPDGYVAVVTIYNFQKFRHIQPPGWSLEWTWADKEIIWSMTGAQTTEQGDCSKFMGNNILPHSCKKNPTVVDLLPGTPYNQQIANCCKGGVIGSWLSDPGNSASSFQLTVGLAGNTNRTVKLPKNFTLKAPGPGYTCGPAQIIPPTIYFSSDGLRFTQALMTWQVICTYSQFLERKTLPCCISLSSNNNNTTLPCSSCACECQKKNRTGGNCVDRKTGLITKPRENTTPIVQCTNHMCPTQIHWNVKTNDEKYWRVKITVTNLNYGMNDTDWNLVVQYPNFDKLIKVSSFNYKTLPMYLGTNDTISMMWGVKKKKNDVIIGAGLLGGKNHVQSELLFRKDKKTSNFAFPTRVFFNGKNCVIPTPDDYPYLLDTATTGY